MDIREKLIRQKVANFKTNDSTIDQENYGVSQAGQYYAILVTKGLTFKVRIFVEFDHPPELFIFINNSISCNSSASDTWLIDERTVFFRSQVKDILVNYEQFFQQLNVDNGLTLLRQANFDPYIRIQLPTNWGENPEAFLKIGDIISCSFGIYFDHTGIYLGGGEVAHVSGHGEGKLASVARIGKLIGDFVKDPTEKIEILVLPLWFRKREDICQEAKNYADDQHRRGEYHILLQNCQNFAFLCATGKELDVYRR